MAISIDYSVSPHVINVPKADLTLVTGTLYEMDLDAFRLELKSFEADETGIVFPDCHTHTGEKTVAGVTFARFVEIEECTVEFEDGTYSVRLAGANTDLFDVENGKLTQNQVQVIPGNSAGLIVVTQGSGLSTEQAAMLDELHKLQGLDAANPMTVTPTSRTTGTISQTISGDGETTSTVTRDA